DRERARITEDLAACEDCYTVFTESALTRVDEESKVESIFDRNAAWFTRQRLVWASAGVALATAASVLLFIGYQRVTAPRAGAELQALVAAVGTDRTIEPRLTGGVAPTPPTGPPSPRA